MLSTPARAPSPAARRDPIAKAVAAKSTRSTITEGRTIGATFALALLTAVSAAGYLRVFSTRSWVGPVMGAVAVIHVVCWATRRTKMPQVAALLLQLLAGWVIVAWTVLGGTTAYGLPIGRTASHFWNEIQQARTDFAGAVAPVFPTTDFKLLAVVGAVLIAIMADWAAFRARSALYGALPPFALFVACCTLGAGHGRPWLIGAWIAAFLVYVASHQATVTRSDHPWFGNHRVGATRWAAGTAAFAGLGTILVALIATPVMSNSEGRGAFGWKGGLGGSSSGPRQVANPVVDLRTRLITEGRVPVFQVQSSVPSYWRLTSLDSFDGEYWTSTDTYDRIASGKKLPGAQAVPAATRTITEQFSVQSLNSPWLPDAFTPVSVTGVQKVSYDPLSGSLITKQATSDGLKYSVVAYQYLSDLHPAELESAPALSSTVSESLVQRYTELPVFTPPSILSLARGIVKGQTTEYGKALAIQNYFLGPDFSYSLDPPLDGTGNAALLNFLFTTKQGYCQQFAGAYAVLARAVGLPTRLAFGFITGSRRSNGSYQVTDGDAHTWPEVYFGAAYGWLPFEPTKGFSNPSSKSYAPTDGTSSQRAPAARATTPPTTAPSANTHRPPSRRGTTATTTPAHSNSNGSSAGLGFLIALGSLLLAAGAWLGIVTGRREIRWWTRRHRAQSDASCLVLARWAEVNETLAWWGVRRQIGETDLEFGDRAARALSKRLGESSNSLKGGVARLASLATEAGYGPALDHQSLGEAEKVSDEIHAGLFRTVTRRQRMLWYLKPKTGLGPA